MYRGFKVEVNTPRKQFAELHALGLKSHQLNENAIRVPLSQFLKQNNSLDGTYIQNSWFPEVNADVFLSHSHNKLDTALIIAGWLYKHFGLTSFIDSAVWGHCDDLLREIDNNYCLMPNNLYNYPLRNQSTAHVHMMLSTALTMMIDKTECLFFLNAPGTLAHFDGTEQTFSPWIYSEIVATQVLRQRLPIREPVLESRGFTGEAIGHLEKSIKISYDLDFTHLNTISGKDLDKWKDKSKGTNGHPLDILYSMLPPKKVKTLI
jgi:hypothetical protein